MGAFTPPFGRPKLLFDGRIEKRSPMSVPIYLATTMEPRSSERAFTRNVSPHGARLVTKRLWQPGEEPLLTPLTGEFPQLARIVYCQPRPRGGFYVGVRFSDRAVRWPDSPGK
jgi:PilZ domain